MTANAILNGRNAEILTGNYGSLAPVREVPLSGQKWPFMSTG